MGDKSIFIQRVLSIHFVYHFVICNLQYTRIPNLDPILYFFNIPQVYEKLLFLLLPRWKNLSFLMKTEVFHFPVKMEFTTLELLANRVPVGQMYEAVNISLKKLLRI
jgi:hypothetical protein